MSIDLIHTVPDKITNQITKIYEAIHMRQAAINIELYSKLLAYFSPSTVSNSKNGYGSVKNMDRNIPISGC